MGREVILPARCAGSVGPMADPMADGDQPAMVWPTSAAPLIIGVAGGSGSGKTTIAEAIASKVGPERAVRIQHDAYYRDLSDLPEAERAAVNFDHPDSLETDLLIGHLRLLRDGKSVECPIYDFGEHVRLKKSETVAPRSVLIVEGILVLVEPALRDLMDVRIFVDTDSDLRLARRLERDVAERGRSVRSVLNQYMKTVRPMHLQFVEPSKRYADVVIPEGYNTNAVGVVTRMIDSVLAEEET